MYPHPLLFTPMQLLITRTHPLPTGRQAFLPALHPGPSLNLPAGQILNARSALCCRKEGECLGILCVTPPPCFSREGAGGWVHEVQKKVAGDDQVKLFKQLQVLYTVSCTPW